VRAALDPGDCLLLGVDLAKEDSVLLPAYDDLAGITEAFNRNLLVRLNRELDAEFEPEKFEHRAIWNAEKSRIEMHLVSETKQTIWVSGIDLRVNFEEGESIHTENSYKYKPGDAESLLAKAGFTPEATWTDARGWFAVCLARVE
jgi:uncharacterized SAM-dependent methyltransferase